MTTNSKLKTEELTLRDIYDDIKDNKMKINVSYQRSEVWKLVQQQSFIDSIIENLPIGVLVLWKNRDGVMEVLDGQQRVMTMVHFFDNAKNIVTSDGKKFSDLPRGIKRKIEAYSFPYLELDSRLDEDQVADIFVRLQEGTPLITPEKVFAFRGNFRKSWFDAYLENKEIFFDKLNKKKLKRFKDRFLSAQFLLLEMKTIFPKFRFFPSLTYNDFEEINDLYKTKIIPKSILRRHNDNIRFLGTFLHSRLGAFEIRDLIAIYILQSYFKQFKTIQNGDSVIFRDFVMDFMHDLNKVKLYKQNIPKGMLPKVYNSLRKYKEFGRQSTSSESVEIRFRIILKEYNRRFGKITIKDRQRFHTTEQKTELFFKQKGICLHCNNEIDFSLITADHRKKHAAGGKTTIHNGRLLHKECHQQIHRTP